MTKYHFNCLHFKGYKPCRFHKTCENCSDFSPYSKKILIIKLGALGDVMRTTPVLFAFHEKNPNAHITWLTKKNAKEILELSPRIHRLLFVDQLDASALLRLQVEEFDEVHCYDKEDAAIAIASLVKAKKKFGFYMNSFGHMAPINQKSEYSFDLGLSDQLKFFKNQKTYQELTLESSELAIPPAMYPYDFNITDADQESAQFVLKRLKHDQSKVPLIGLNTGSGRVFRTKQWTESGFIELAKMLKKKLKARVLLLGGEDEDARNKRLAEKLKGVAYYPGCNFSIRQFAAIIEACDVLVTGDTLAMHLSLGVKTPPVVLFGSTCAQEVDLYGMGRKILNLPSCAPCYKNECDQPDWMKCMKDISASTVFEAVQDCLFQAKNNGPDAA